MKSRKNRFEDNVLEVQIDCQTINMFRFKMPKEDIGRDDITIYVEYGENISDRKQVAYSVWAQIDNKYVRALLICDGFNATIDNDIIYKIVEHINSSEWFYDRLLEFLLHFDR